MNPLQRFAALSEGRPLDRLPCVPIVGNTAARVIGVRTSEIRGAADLLACAHAVAYRRFRYDVIRVFTDLYVQAEAMGAKVRVPEDETAYLHEPAISSGSDVDRLSRRSREGRLLAHPSRGGVSRGGRSWRRGSGDCRGDRAVHDVFILGGCRNSGAVDLARTSRCATVV